jgi:O-antigen/teichoic acid export membrane protein
MGVIQRQGLKSSVISYFGIFLGFFATVYIYPLDFEAKGILEYITNLAILFLPYAQLGVLAIYHKYFPKFLNNLGGFQKWVIKRTVLQFIVFTTIYLFVREPLADLLYHLKIDINKNFLKYSMLIPLLILFLIAQGFFVSLCETNKRIVMPDIIRNLVQKIYFPLIIILKVYLNLEASTFILLFFLYYFITIPLLFLYTVKEGFYKLKSAKTLIIEPALKKEMNSYNLFSILNDISSQLATKIDTVMVGSMITNPVLAMVQAGIYSTVMFMSNAISIPSNSILRISNPLVATYMANNETNETASLYKKTSITLLILGLGTFFILWPMFTDIFSLTKYSEQMLIGKYVFLYLAISKLFDMVTSINSYILVYSKFYKANLVFVSTLGVLNIFLNIKLIPIYGMEGAAIASLISLISYNIFKLFYIYIKLKIHPFSKDTIKVLIIGTISFFILYWIPEGKYFGNAYVNLICKGVIVGTAVILTFALPIYLLKISKEINGLVNKVLNKLKILN